jgi:hypothetical protein
VPEVAVPAPAPLSLKESVTVPKAADVAITNGISVQRIVFFICLFFLVLILCMNRGLVADVYAGFDGQCHARQFSAQKASKIYGNFSHC